MTVWYDFTITLRNKGRNGIAAVEWNLGSALLEAEPTVRCFALARRGLVDIDPRTDLAAAFYASPAAIAPPVVSRSIPTWRGRWKSTIVRMLGSYADLIFSCVASARRWALRARQRVSSTIDRSLSAASPNVLASQVAGDDVVISVGADWSGVLLERLADLKRRTGCRVITMVYDMVPLTHNHLAFHNEPALFLAYYARLAAVSDLVMCISEQSRQDFVRIAAERGWRVPRTMVLRLAESVPDDMPPVTREDYYLWVGTLERRKNLELIYDALRIVESEGGEVPTVVVAGGVGWGIDDLLAELELQSTTASRSMVLLGSVDEHTLDSLYRRARALLFPSHYEGWGLPVREAAVRGCPVAAGDSPAVREALVGYEGGVVLPVDDPGPWADYLRAGPPHVGAAAGVRTWSDTAAQLVHAVTDIA